MARRTLNKRQVFVPCICRQLYPIWEWKYLASYCPLVRQGISGCSRGRARPLGGGIKKSDEGNLRGEGEMEKFDPPYLPRRRSHSASLSNITKIGWHSAKLLEKCTVFLRRSVIVVMKTCPCGLLVSAPVNVAQRQQTHDHNFHWLLFTVYAKPVHDLSCHLHRWRSQIVNWLPKVWIRVT